MKKNLIFLLLGLFSTGMLMAQYGKQKKADALFNKFSFVQAAETYKELVANNYNTDYAVRQLADCYFLLRDPQQAANYYEEAVTQEQLPPEYYYNYALVLRSLGRNEEAMAWARTYKEKGGEGRLYRELKNEEARGSIFDVKEKFEVTPVAFNSAYSDFGAFEFEGELYFVSARPHASKRDKLYKWNEQPFLDIFKRDAHGISAPVQGVVNSKYHEGPLVISPDGNSMYFSRNNYNNKKMKTDTQGTNHLKIYRATLVNGQWENTEDLPFNGDDYSVSHPALSPDGKTLYFASDMPGGYGKTDLYKTEVLQDGTFGPVVNLGPGVNTSEDELFPYLNNEGSLFFASDGHGGYGMLDIFATVKDGSGEISSVVNLGKPVNSPMDDFSFYMAEDGFTGYFSSNRKDPPFNDDIYAFEKIPPLMLRGLVKDSVNHRPIANARISLTDADGEEIAFLETDENGRYEINIDRETRYRVGAQHSKYQEGNLRGFNTVGVKNRTTEVIVNMQLMPVRDIRVLADLDNIYFDYAKYDIRPDAAKELDKIVKLLTEDYPDMVMRIEAHTDSRGSASFNDRLSLDRANATAEYLIAKGLARERIIAARGFGEQRLTNGCVDGVECEEPDHQLNRRTEFIVERME